MNLSVLIIPALCGKLDETQINQIFSSTKYMALKKWEDDNIPYKITKNVENSFIKLSQK